MIRRTSFGQSGLSRREMNTMLASLGLAAVTIGAGSREAHADNQVTYYTWSGYELPVFHQPYIDKYHAKPNITFFGDVDEALSKLRSGYTVDISHPCADNVKEWYDAGILRPIDTSRLTYWNDLFPVFRDLKGTTTPDGQHLFIPWDWGNSSVLYRTDLVDPYYQKHNSWKLLYDERYKGRLATYDSAAPNVQIAACILGYRKDIWHLSDGQLAEVHKLLLKQRKLLRFYWSSESEAEQAMVSGEIVAMYSWNDGYTNVKKQGVPVAYMNPKEGARNWVCGFVLMKNHLVDDQKIYDFLNAMMRPQSGAYLISQDSIGNANSKAYDLVPKARLKEVGLDNPQAFLSDGIFLLPLAPKYKEKYVKLWNDVKSGT